LQTYSAELTQHQAVANEVLGLRVAPVVQVLHDQQSQDHLHRRGRSPGLGRVRSAPTQVGFDVLKQVVILEQAIEFGQLRLKTQRQGGYQCEQVDWRRSIS